MTALTQGSNGKLPSGAGAFGIATGLSGDDQGAPNNVISVMDSFESVPEDGFPEGVFLEVMGDCGEGVYSMAVVDMATDVAVGYCERGRKDLLRRRRVETPR